MKTRAESLWDKYIELWHRLSGWRLFLFYTLHYTALFLVMWLILFSAFMENGKDLIWSPDGVSLWCTDLMYISKNFRASIKDLLNGNGWTFPVYDFAKGMIERDLRLEPIQLLAVFWPSNKIDKLYDILVVLRYYLAGLSFSALGFYFKQKPMPIMIGTISYVFCQYALYTGVRHPFFMQAMIYLPILTMGIEKVMRKEKPFLLIGIIFMILSSNVYWACIQALLAGVYVICRFPSMYEKNRFHEFGYMVGRLLVSVAIALLLSGALFAAPLLQNLRAGRVGNSDVWQYNNLFHYAKQYYSKFISYFVVDGANPGSWVHLGFSVIAVPAIAILYINKKKHNSTLRILFPVLTVMLMLPIVAYVMSGFNAVTNRWCLAYAFCVSEIIMFQLPDLAEMDRNTLVKTSLSVLAYYIVCRFVIIEKYYKDYVMIFAIVTMIVLALCSCLDSSERKKVTLIVCLLITCVSVNFTAHQLFDKDKYGYVSEFNDKDTFYEGITQSPYGSFKKSNAIDSGDSFYRVAQSKFASAYCNAPFYLGINGTDGHNQWYYQGYDNWIREMEVAQPWIFGVYHGVDARAMLQALDSIKYYVLRGTNENDIPYGFSQIEKIKSGKNTDLILMNQYMLPLGYTYDRFIGYDEYDSMNSLEKQETQLQAVVLENTPRSEDIKKASLSLTAQQVPVINTDLEDVEWKDGKLKVLKDGGKITLSMEGKPGSETYLRVVNLDLTNGTNTSSWNLQVSAGSVTKEANFTPDAEIYSNKMKTQLINLGYSKEGLTTCVISFPKKGTFILDGLQIWCQPMDDFAGQIETLRAEPLENIEINRRGFTGTVSLSKDKILCVSVPYADGWTAYVDGEKAEILQVNTAFMGIELTAGEHTIEFKYSTPGFKAGIVMSIAGLVALAAFVLCWRKKPLWLPNPEQDATDGDGNR